MACANEPPETRLAAVLDSAPTRLIACSGGVDSMTLATFAHRLAPETTLIAHALSPAVPEEATARVRSWAEQEGWHLQLVRSGEFDSADYLSNPVNRCYHCKSHLYDAMETLKRIGADIGAQATLMSGANLDDLGEYRPGLEAAAEHGVRHPLIEAGIDKQGVRAMARGMGLLFADLPASPCLASRLYTGTRVTAERLAAVHMAEKMIRERTGLEVVRCRLRDNSMLVEVAEDARALISADLLSAIETRLANETSAIAGVELDPLPYRAGRAFVAATT